MFFNFGTLFFDFVCFNLQYTGYRKKRNTKNKQESLIRNTQSYYYFTPNVFFSKSKSRQLNWNDTWQDMTRQNTHSICSSLLVYTHTEEHEQMVILIKLWQFSVNNFWQVSMSHSISLCIFYQLPCAFGSRPDINSTIFSVLFLWTILTR